MICLALFLSLFLGGCAAAPAIGGAVAAVDGALSIMSRVREMSDYRRSVREARARAYQGGFREGMRSVATEFRSKEAMNKPYVWNPPLVQEVDVPARIRQGVMIPAHREPVVVSPGRWVRIKQPLEGP